MIILMNAHTSHKIPRWQNGFLQYYNNGNQREEKEIKKLFWWS